MATDTTLFGETGLPGRDRVRAGAEFDVDHRRHVTSATVARGSVQTFQGPNRGGSPSDGPAVAQSIESGGGSPGGNMDAITGPLEALDYVASQVDPSRDGFSLDRDDEAVQAAWPRSLFT